MAKILMAENHRDFREEWAATLRGEGFEVTEADSVSTARSALEKGGFDLAILDLRLDNDDDPKDQSGLILAKEFRRAIRIIILCGVPTEDTLLWALQQEERITVVKKGQGPDILLKEMRKLIKPKVFLSHGRDKRATSEVTALLERGGVEVVVLRDKPGAGRTVIEKFEKYANVNFAIVLMTPDDAGSLKDEAPRPRARQNVIFELGFFLAKLGRDRVIALFKQDAEPIELPSNYYGVQNLDMDSSGGWHSELARELRQAGIELHLV